jgi:hypothetical protein
MNPLSLLPIHTKSFSNLYLQASELSNLINKAIVKDKNYIIYDKFIYPANIKILNQKDYYIEKYINNYIIYWNDYNGIIDEIDKND